MPATPITQTPSTSAPNATQTQLTTVSTSTSTKYDVFLSFRGKDTRLNFTGHLYQRLHDHGIRTYMDDPELRSGEVISDALIQAIHDSMTYIVVFSENYASSTWCLDELVEILKCHKTAQRLVVPVFYKIDPSLVRHQIGSFKKALKKHRVRFEFEKVNNWCLTLEEVAGFSGHHISEDRSEADGIIKIFDDLLLKINPKTLDVAKYPVGLDSRVKDITKLLSSDKEGVIKIGIHGMGGVGKTTLAKAVYNQNCTSFHGSCFLADVREVSRRENGLVSLQQKLIDNVLERKNEKIDNVYQGIELIRARICSKKVLIVIDDLDSVMPLEFIVGSFATGSIIIITTRNEDLFDSVKVEARYKVNELGDAESCQLFTQHAFDDNKIPDTFTELSQEILEHAGGLPLALKVFGSNLLNQPEGVWRWFINKLKRVSIEDVEIKLMISFEALKSIDPMLQNIFLDIACFFVGHNKEEVVIIMETCYTFVNHHIDILNKRCLLTINNEDQLGMHDLLQDMGRNIARNKSPDEPEKHSRLWVSKDIFDVLKKPKGTETVECIFSRDNNQDALEGLSFTTETFKTMSKLRFLHLEKVNITGSFEQIFEDLRFLYWEYCPLRCLPSEFDPPKLVILELPYSKLRTLWEQNMVSHVFGKLKTLNMSHSEDLITTPDFINLPSLETLNLRGCKSLEEVHISIGSLRRLVSLDLWGCEKLRNLPDTICNLMALKFLNISNCNSLEAVPIQLGNIKSLTTLRAYRLTVSKLPDSIGHLSKLVELDLSYNKKLETLPVTICNLRSLEYLNTNGCSRLKALPEIIGSSEIALSLQILVISHSGITALPSGFSQLSNLQSIYLVGCHFLSIPKLPPSLKQIMAGGCSSLERLPNLSNLKHLEKLDLSSCYGLTEIQGLQELNALIELDLTFCMGLRYIQGLDGLTSIKMLHLGDLDCLVAYNHLTKRLFQVYSEIGHQISVYVKSLRQWPGWITESPYWTSKSETTTVYAHLLPNQSHNFMGIILCFQRRLYYSAIDYSVKNTTSGFIWTDSLDLPSCEILMVIVSKSIFSVRDEDHRIELRANNINIFGIHLLYNTDTEIFEDVVQKHAIDIDALKLVDHVLQDIFLDIACFFIGWEKNKVVPVLETYYTNVDHYIDILKNTCLLKINDKDELEIDHLLQHLGRKISRNNSLDEPGKHNRLWLSLDIYDVFKNHKGTEVVEGIVPHKVYMDYNTDALEGESFTLKTFQKMRKLRFLYLKKVHLTGSFEHTFEDLRWLCWDYCPLKCLPSELYPPKIVILELPHSNIITMWELNMVPHVFQKLKTLNMSYSLDLTTTPDFTKLPHLETLNLEGCESLEELHITIGSLVRLVSLDLHGCVKLRSLPDTICNLRALEVLDIRDCKCLEALPTALGNMQSLRELNAEDLNVSKLPNSIGLLRKLVELNLRRSKYLQTLPHTFCNLIALEVLDISDCSCLEALPTALGNVRSLRKLKAENLTVSKLSESIGHLSNLVELRLNSNKNLKTLPVTICNLISLEILDISGCEKLEILPDQLCRVTSLRELIAGGATILKTFPRVESNQTAFSLQKLDFSKSGLTALPSGISKLSNLEELNLENCRCLVSITELPCNLKWIRADGCMSMVRLPNLSNLKQLEYLNLEGCSGLTEIQGLKGLTSIRRLHLEGCNSSLLAYIFTESFFQMYSEFGHPIGICSTEFPDWISQSSESTMLSKSTMSLNLPPNLSHNYLGMILCVRSKKSFYFFVEKTTSDFIWRGEFDSHGDKSLMVIVPRSTFSVEDGDDRIELKAYKHAKVYGIHLLYKTEEHDSTSVNED